MERQTYPNALYASLQPRSAADSDHSARTILPLGPHLLHSGGVRVAALGLAAEHGTAAFAFNGIAALPISIAISERGVDTSLSELEISTQMRHQGRTVMVTTMEACAPDARHDRVAFGTITWAVLPAPTEPRRSANGIAEASGTLAEIAGITEKDGRCAILSVDEAVSGPGGILHAGALQILAEEAATDAVRQALGDDRLTHLNDATFHFFRAGREGPFVARHRVFRGDRQLWDVEVEVTDGKDRVCTLATFRMQADGN
jgi:acyl-coenzyme A thioesterase PaaI-like protein